MRPLDTKLSPPLWLLAVLGLALCYVALGRVGLEFARHTSYSTVVWPPTGLSLAALLVLGRRAWPGVWIGALAVNLSVPPHLFGVSAAIATGNTLEALLGAWLLERSAGFSGRFDRVGEILLFLVCGMIIPTVVSASVGVSALALGGELSGTSPWPVWRDWWLGDASGALVVAPALLTLVTRSGVPRRPGHRWEVVAVGVLLAVTCGLAFSDVFGAPVAGLPLGFLPLPVLMWAGLRFGPRGAATASMAMSAVATWGTAHGFGSLAVADPDLRILVLWLFMTVVSGSALLFGAAVASTARAEAHRRRLHDRILQAQKLESLGLMAGGVAHDFKNLLHTIQGNADLLAQDQHGDAHSTERLRHITSATQRAADLCAQLLVFSGRGKTASRRVDLSGLVVEMAKLLEVSISKSARLVRDLEPQPPAVAGDPAQLRQLIMNLIVNASEALEDREGTIRLHTSTVDADATTFSDALVGQDLPPGRYVLLEVSDTGRGMSAETLDHIFEPFFTTKDEGGERGLGMAAVLGVVRAHQGAIQVGSRLGHGTTFRLYFPTAEGPAEEPRKTPDAVAPVRVARQAAALVIDDEQSVRMLAKSVLERSGLDVLMAEDGQRGLEIFREHLDHLDLVVLDWSMPRLAGAEALAEIRRMAPDVPVVISTGFNLDDLPELEDDGALFVLRKPYRPQVLADLVADIVGRVSTRRIRA